MSPLMRFQMLSLASNNQLEDTQHDGGDTALIMSNNKKRKLSRASEHKTSEPTETCSYCQKHGGNPVGYAWQECRKLKVSKDKAENNQSPPSNRQNPQKPSSSKQGASNQTLIAGAAGTLVSTDLPQEMVTGILITSYGTQLGRKIVGERSWKNGW
ncbi:hypothetical protein L211DRAFT_197504 [Terfezia boudieri ATCC MYA-4762]|uniref:Uncharacterized protein n=1 Tax=Terfezia boudieri ATCC MYA-4762 TaxID=1051890 RepID=A0A3N4LM95_9PEZI|nr:hypothetical protein L211DRAFT_197504 [Terfezia boudieri ATCC MYA-4762]